MDEDGNLPRREKSGLLFKSLLALVDKREVLRSYSSLERAIDHLKRLKRLK